MESSSQEGRCLSEKLGCKSFARGGPKFERNLSVEFKHYFNSISSWGFLLLDYFNDLAPGKRFFVVIFVVVCFSNTFKVYCQPLEFHSHFDYINFCIFLIKKSTQQQS